MHKNMGLKNLFANKWRHYASKDKLFSRNRMIIFNGIHR